MDFKDVQVDFDEKLRRSVKNLVKNQDFNAIATPLKTDFQIKNELEEKIIYNLSLVKFSKNIEDALVLINQYLKEFEEKEVKDRVEYELIHSLDHFREVNLKFKNQELELENWFELKKTEAMWTFLYGISTDTILLLYKPVLIKVNDGQYADAKKILSFILFYAPEISSYWNALGICCQKEGDMDEALGFYNISKEMNPDYLETYFYLARCYKEKGDLPLAFEQVNLLKIQMRADPLLKEEWQSSVEELETFLNGS